LETAGDTVGIRVLDHVIVGDGGYSSMLEKGYLRGK
jgi:DNA repair protein RadC